MVSDAKVAPVRARAPLAASVWHPWYVHWPFITGPVEVPIAELEVEVVVVPPTAVEVLTVEPGGTTTIVTAMHGFVGSNAEKLSIMAVKFHTVEFNDLPGLFGGEYLNSYPLFPEATRTQMSPPTGDCWRVTKAS